MSFTIESGYVPGCVGRIAELHAQYYARASGFGATFEAKVARELGEFCVVYRPDRDGLWLARIAERIEGAIAIDGANAAAQGAHLRWFIASDALRGRGAGHALLEAALRFSDCRGYERIYLWTFEGLHAARHLYEKHGFRLSRQSPGNRWGNAVNEQCFTRERP